MMIDPGKLPLGRKSNNSSNREQEQGKRERETYRKITQTHSPNKKKGVVEVLFFFLFRRFSSVLYRWGRNCPFSFFFSFFACLYAVTTCRNQKRSQIRENKETKPESNRNNLAEDFFWIKQKKDLWKGWERKNEAGGNWSGILWRWRRGRVARQRPHERFKQAKEWCFFYMVYSVIAG